MSARRTPADGVPRSGAGDGRGALDVLAEPGDVEVPAGQDDADPLTITDGDPARGPAVTDRGREARGGAAPADADDDEVDVGNVLEDLEPDGPLARDDRVVVERVAEDEAALRDHPLHRRPDDLKRPVDEDH